MALTKRGYFKKDLKQSWFNKSTEHCKGERALHIVEGVQLSGPIIRPCLVPRPQYFRAVNRFGSHGPGGLSGIHHRNQSDREDLGESRKGTRKTTTHNGRGDGDL